MPDRLEQRIAERIRAGAARRELLKPAPLLTQGSRKKDPIFGAPLAGKSAETTALPERLEAEFQKWVKRNRVTDLDHPESFYDYRGAFLAGVNRDPGEEGHFPDTFKQHGHPTFSVESRYSSGADDGGRWEGERYIPAGPSPESVLGIDDESRIARILAGEAPDTIAPVVVRETTGLRKILDDAAEGTGALNPIRALSPLYRGGKAAAGFIHEMTTKPLVQAVSPLIGSQDMRGLPLGIDPGDPQAPDRYATAETGGVTPTEKIQGGMLTAMNVAWPGAQRVLTKLAAEEVGKGLGARVLGSAATGGALMGGHGAAEGALEPAGSMLERGQNIIERGSAGVAMGVGTGAVLHSAFEAMPATARLAARAAKKGGAGTKALLEDFSLDPARMAENRAMRGIFSGLDDDLAIGHRAPEVHPWEGVRSPRPTRLEPSASSRGIPSSSSSSAESSIERPGSESASMGPGAGFQAEPVQISGTALPATATTRKIAGGEPGILAGAESTLTARSGGVEVTPNIQRGEAEVTLPELGDEEYHALRRGNPQALVEAWAARVQRRPGQHRVGPGPTKGPIQPTDNPEELIELGRQVFPAYKQDLEEVAAGAGVRFFGARHKTLNPDGSINAKGAERFRQKVTNGEAAGWSTQYQGDVVGGRILIDTAAEAESVLAALEARGYKQQEIDDFLTPEIPSDRGGYRAIHAQLRTPAGMSVELQMMPREMSLAQEHPFGHKIYQALRDPSAHPSSYEYQQMKRMARKHYQVAYEAWKRRANTVYDPAAASVDPEVVAQPVPGASRVTGPAYQARTADLHVDPERFQFKQDVDRTTGAGTGISGAKRYDPDFAGTLDVWVDPANGKTYVVNGHHRNNLARRDNVEFQQVRNIEAPDAKSARTFGALINIAEGRGTALDVAKFIKDSGLSVEGLAARNVNVKAGLAKDGTALSRLPDDLISKVTRDPDLLRKAVAIGEVLESPEQQRAAFKIVETKKLTEREVTELAKVIRSAGSEEVETVDLFGDNSVAKSLFVEKAKVASAIRDRLSKDKRLFGYVSNEGRAAELERGGNKIDAAKSRAIAEQSAQLEELFERLYSKSGPLGSLMDGAARRVAQGEKPAAVAASIYDEIQAALEGEVPRPAMRRAGQPGSTNEAAGLELGGMSGSGLGGAAGGIAGGQIGDTPEERRRNAQIGAALGFGAGAAGGAKIGKAAFRAEGRALARTARVEPVQPARLSITATPKRVAVKLQGPPSAEQLNEILTQVRTHPGASFRYTFRDRIGRQISGGRNLWELFADQRFGESNASIRAARIGGGEGFVGDSPKDLFGAETGPAQGGLFGAEAGRSAGAKPSGNFAAKQAEARANADFLRKQMDRIKDPKVQAKVAAQVAELERIAGFDEKITAGEMSRRAVTDEPEKIRVAASRVNGEVFEGEVHAVARQKAIDAGAVSEYYGHRTGEPGLPVEDGFLTTKGRFVDRVEAQQIAEGVKQMPKAPAYMSYGADGGELEAEYFNKVRFDQGGTWADKQRARNATGAVGDQPITKVKRFDWTTGSRLDMKTPKGEIVVMIDRKAGKAPHVEFIGFESAEAEMGGFRVWRDHENKLGPGLMRKVMREIRKAMPELDGSEVTSVREGGVRRDRSTRGKKKVWRFGEGRGRTGAVGDQPDKWHGSVGDGDGEPALEKIIARHEQTGTQLWVSQKGNVRDVLALDKIEVPKNARGEGLGTSALRDLIRYADDHGQTIALDVGQQGAAKVRLERWYAEHGFRRNKGRRPEISESWIREPNRSGPGAGDQPGLTAAIRLRDGTIFEGRTHFDAVKKIDASGRFGEEFDDELIKATDGFIGPDGKFLARREAGAVVGYDGPLSVEELRRINRKKGRTGAIGDQPDRGAYLGESDLLNVSKIVESSSARERVAQAAEKYRTVKEGQKQTWAEADVEVNKAVRELLAEDPKARRPHLARKLTGVQLLARRDVVRQNDAIIEDLSRKLASGTLTVAEHDQAQDLMRKAVEHNDVLLSDLITGASQKGRDLNLLRRIANKSLDHDVWQIQAKRMLADRPLTDEIAAQLRRLVNEAREICG